MGNWESLWELAACGLPASNGAAKLILGNTSRIVTLEWPDGLREQLRWDGRDWWSHGDGITPAPPRPVDYVGVGPYRSPGTFEQAMAIVAALEVENTELRSRLMKKKE